MSATVAHPVSSFFVSVPMPVADSFCDSSIGAEAWDCTAQFPGLFTGDADLEWDGLFTGDADMPA